MWMSKRTDFFAGRVIIGKIQGPHGIQGMLRLYALTDFPERFEEMKTMTVQFAPSAAPRQPGIRKPKEPVVYTVRSVAYYEGRKGGNTFLLDLEGVDSREDAEALKGAFVTIAPEERAALAEDEYWVDDVLGMAVQNADDGRELGTVEDVVVTGSNDVYAVRTPEGQLKMIPAVAEVIRAVDTASKIMKVSLPEGLWD